MSRRVVSEAPAEISDRLDSYWRSGPQGHGVDRAPRAARPDNAFADWRLLCGARRLEACKQLGIGTLWNGDDASRNSEGRRRLRAALLQVIVHRLVQYRLETPSLGRGINLRSNMQVSVDSHWRDRFRLFLLPGDHRSIKYHKSHRRRKCCFSVDRVKQLNVAFDSLGGLVAEQRVPDRRIREAITSWRGNIQAAAEEVGMRPKNFRKRLNSLRIDADSLRPGKGVTTPTPLAPSDPHSPSRPPLPPYPPLTPISSSDPLGPLNPSAPYISESAGPTLGDVSTAATAATLGAEPAPIRSVKGRNKQLRVRPDNQEMIREAKLDVWAKLRIESDENELLNQFIAEKFPSWIQSKTEPGRKK